MNAALTGNRSVLRYMEQICMNDFFQALTGIGAIGTAIAAWVAFGQLKQMKISLDDTRNWNKLSTAFNLFPNTHEFNEIEQQLNKSCIKLIDRNSPLTQAELDELLSPEQSDTRILLKNYLNELESYCTAVNMGVADEGAAKRKYSHKIERHFIEMKPYIDNMRAVHNTKGLFVEIEILVNKWQCKQEQDPSY